ncbi:MAG: type II secretion system protein [Microcoleus sp. SIO2G3]|nr:type II secretion system protein [Microcoleus sp. SIO2G3]
MKFLLHRSSASSRSTSFTLVELIGVMALLGILMAIAAPSWNAFFQHRQLAAAQERTAQAIRNAQHQASLSRTRKAIAFRETPNGVEWSVYPTSGSPTEWRSLSIEVAIDASNTTLHQTGNLYRLQFNEDGHVVGQLGRMTLTIPQTQLRRCVFASTLLGAVRRAEGNACIR